MLLLFQNANFLTRRSLITRLQMSRLKLLNLRANKRCATADFPRPTIYPMDVNFDSSVANVHRKHFSKFVRKLNY